MAKESHRFSFSIAELCKILSSFTFVPDVTVFNGKDIYPHVVHNGDSLSWWQNDKNMYIGHRTLIDGA